MKRPHIVRRLLILAAAGSAMAALGDPALRAAEPVPAICLAPGTSKAKLLEIERFYAQQRPNQSFQFGDFDGWDATATNPGPRVHGDPMTIRWSIVPDGTSLPSGAGEAATGSNLRAFLNGIYGSEATWRPLFTAVFADWGARTGITYVFEPNDDGAPSPGTAGSINVRGDVRIGGHFIDGNSNILAYNYFPNLGDMVIDTGDNFYAQDAANHASQGFKNMLAHEHGHGIGLSHVCPVDQSKLMEPFISYNFSGPQHDDTLAGNRGYGDDKEPDDFSGAPANLGAVPNGVTAVNGVSVDDASDVDFYKFTVPAGRRIDVSVTPVGFTYVQGPQNGDGSCSAGSPFNSLVQSDLTLQVIGTDGTTVLATANSAPPGSTEFLNDVNVGVAGSYYLRVSGSASAAQLYNLSLNVENLPAVLSVNDVSVPEQSGPAVFTVSLSSPAASTVTVQYATAPNSATSPADFTATSGTLTFLSGETSKPVPVPIVNDITDEPNETFFLNLSNPSGSSISDAQGVGTIVDDDPNADLSVTKSDGVTSAIPGQVLVYTIVVANAGPNVANGSTVSDPLPAGLINASWTCAAAGGAACGAANGTGSIAQMVNLPVGGSVTYTLTATVAPNPTTVSNTVTATVPAGFGEPNPANNSATDTDLLACDPYTVLLADGRSTKASLAAGGTAWYLAGLRIGSSYSVEATNDLGTGAPTVTLYKGDDGCSGTSTAAHDTTGIDPRAGAASRGSITATGVDGGYRIKVVNSTGSTMAYSIRVADTTLYSTAFSTNSTFNTYYSFQNSTNTTVNGVLTLRDTTGAVVGTLTLAIPAGRTGSTNTQALAVPRGRTGTAQFSHDGPPGAISGEADIANFSTTPAYIQPVKMLPVREQR